MKNMPLSIHSRNIYICDFIFDPLENGEKNCIRLMINTVKLLLMTMEENVIMKL